MSDSVSLKEEKGQPIKGVDHSKIAQVSVKDLIPYARNSRTHSDEQVTQIASSIKEWGFTTPVLIDADKQIIAGHGRTLAAKKLGMKTVPCLTADGWTDAQTKAYVIAYNKLALNAGWDDEMLRVEFEELSELGFDLELTGFDADELELLLPIDETEGLTDEDEVPDPPEIPVSKLGDVWLLGNHRLMCGDSTSIDAVDKLMDCNKADMVFTDPPYNIDYQGVSDKREKIKNDKMPDGEFVDFLTESIMGCETMYVCCSWQYAHLFKEAMERLSRKPKAMIVWNKVNPAQHLDKYFKQHEIIFYYGDFGGHKTLRGDIWEMKRQKNTVHPTMKPVELIDMAMEDQPDKKIVYDAFGGSGSTLISCEKSHKDCRMMELDEKYIDVIIQRWQNFTGKEAILETSKQPYNELKQGGAS
jgi:DNA modification methylase